MANTANIVKIVRIIIYGLMRHNDAPEIVSANGKLYFIFVLGPFLNLGRSLLLI